MNCYFEYSIKYDFRMNIHMRILQLHCNKIQYTPIRKEILNAEKITPCKHEFSNIIVAFISVEKGDNEEIIKNISTELKKSIRTLNCNKLLLYPYSHLSSELASSEIAFDFIKKLRSQLQKFEVYSAPFGWTKSYNLEIKGHPLAEHLIIENKKSMKHHDDISKALDNESKIISTWFIMTTNGELHKINDFNFHMHNNLEILYNYEVSNKHIANIKPPHIKLMKKLAIADYESASDSGNMKFFPNGKLMKSLIEKYVTNEIIDYGGIEVETPIMYDSCHPSLSHYFNRFPARQYNITSENKQLILRFAACFGQFLMMNNFNLSYKTLPLKLYELTRYSFRREQSGELVGLKRLRAFTMPDCHAFCKDMNQAINELKTRFELSKKIIHGLSIMDSDYEMVIRTTEDFFNNNKELIRHLVTKMNKPVLIELWKDKFFYFVLKWEFNYIDNLNNASALSTDQIDIENGHKFGITFTNEKNDQTHPIILHNSPSGAIERVIYALLENTAKQISKNIKPYLPIWLSPIQIRIIPINNKFIEYCDNLAEQLTTNKIRVDIDDRNYSTSKKIRLAETEWIPYVLLIGDKEIISNHFNIRERHTGNIVLGSIEHLANKIKKQTEGKPFSKLNSTRYVSARPVIIA